MTGAFVDPYICRSGRETRSGREERGRRELAPWIVQRRILIRI